MSTIYKKYSSIPNFYANRRVLDLPLVVAQEKVDGTNFSFGTVKDSFVMNSRNHLMWKFNKRDKTESHIPQFDGFGAVARFKELHPNAFEKLEETGKNLLFFGEFYGRGIQKRMNYCGEEKHFVFFDIYDVDEDGWLPHDKFVYLCTLMRLPVAPVLYQGPPDKEKFDQLLEEKSWVGRRHGLDCPSEGVIIKGLNADLDDHGERIIAKHKSEQFMEICLTQKEMADVRRKKGETGAFDYARDLAHKYVTESRLENCLEKFRSESKGMTIKIISEVINYMKEDVVKDLLEEDKSNELFNLKLLEKAAGAESAILYKNWLKKQGN